MPKPPATEIDALRAGCLLKAETNRALANHCIVLAGRPSTSHRDKLALERIAATAGDLAMLLSMFGRG